MDIGRLAWRVFTRGHGLTLQAEAADLLRARFCPSGLDAPDEAHVLRVLGHVASACKLADARAGCRGLVSASSLAAVLDELVAAHGASPGASASRDGPAAHVRVVSAGDAPVWEYDGHARAFRMRRVRRTAHGAAETRGAMYRARHAAVLQRTQRLWAQGDAWRSDLLGGRAGPPESPLLATGIKGVRGLDACVSLLGMLSVLADDELHLEDPDDSVRLSVSAPADRLVAETALVVVEGFMADGVFKVLGMWAPPVEGRSSALAAHAPDVVSAVLGREGAEAAHVLGARCTATAAAVVLSHVQLDRDAGLARLERLLSGFAAPPPALVLLGPLFCDGPSGSLDGLAGVLQRHARALAGTRLVLVPAQGDFGAPGVLPVPAVPRDVAEDAAIGGMLVPLVRLGLDAVLASNPCRLVFYDRELLLFAHDDLGAAMVHANADLCASAGLTHSPLQPTESNPAQAGASGGLAAADYADVSRDAQTSHTINAEAVGRTVLEQATLVPLPLPAQPVYWELAGTLAAYPPPDVLVLGARAASRAAVAGCAVVQPGSFADDGVFAVVFPMLSRVDLCFVKS